MVNGFSDLNRGNCTTPTRCLIKSLGRAVFVSEVGIGAVQGADQIGPGVVVPWQMLILFEQTLFRSLQTQLHQLLRFFLQKILIIDAIEAVSRSGLYNWFGKALQTMALEKFSSSSLSNLSVEKIDSLLHQPFETIAAARAQVRESLNQNKWADLLLLHRMLDMKASEKGAILDVSSNLETICALKSLKKEVEGMYNCIMILIILLPRHQ